MNIKKINKKLNNNIYILKIKSDPNDKLLTLLANSSINMYSDYDFFKSLDGDPLFCTLTNKISETKKFKSKTTAKKFILKHKLNNFDIIKMKI